MEFQCVQSRKYSSKCCTGNNVILCVCFSHTMDYGKWKKSSLNSEVLQESDCFSYSGKNELLRVSGEAGGATATAKCDGF